VICDARICDAKICEATTMMKAAGTAGTLMNRITASPD
jgi:hypothetical protein